MDHITDELPEARRAGHPGLLVGGDRDPSPAPDARDAPEDPRLASVVALAGLHFANRDQPEAWNRARARRSARRRVESGPPRRAV